jgi:hypothetical protein
LTTGGLLILLAGFYFMASYRGAKDTLIKQDFENRVLRQAASGQQPTLEMQQKAVSFSNALLNGLEQDRQSIYGADLLRTILLIMVAVGFTALYLKGKLDRKVLLGTLILLSSFDLLAVGRRYLNEESFAEKIDSGSELSPTAADQQVRNDPEKNFRVFDVVSGDPFTDARTSYFHNSLGGYSPAKLGLYQDLIENQLRKGNLLVLNMLNTKYFIQEDPASHHPIARLNPGAYGPCWLVKSIHYVKNGDEEMKALDSINTRDTVIIQQKYANLVKFQTVPDTMASVRLMENLNDKIDYHFSAKTNQFAVFSEVYYDKGWNAFIDGKKADYIRVDYILRGMSVPAGEHQIEFRFEPYSYVLGNKVAVWSSILAYLLVIAAFAMEIRERRGRSHPGLA